jgi:hypothetical protein
MLHPDAQRAAAAQRKRHQTMGIAAYATLGSDHVQSLHRSLAQDFGVLAV